MKGRGGTERSVIRLRRRDGSVVGYDPARVRESVRRAQAAAADADELFAVEVEEVVRLALDARPAGTRAIPAPVLPEPGAPAPSRVLAIDELVDLVERALIEMGRARVAKAFIVHRDRRDQSRAALEVLQDEPPGSRAVRERRQPLVRDGEGARPWNKGRITAALMREAELPREIAEQVAERVEQRVLDGGWKRLTSGFVRELVGNELAAMGFAEARRRQEPVALPRHDLRRLLRAGPRPGARDDEAGTCSSGAIGETLAGEVLRRYAIDDVLDESSAESHLRGDLAIEDLDRAHLPLVRALPLDLVIEGEHAATAAFGALERIGALLAHTAHGLVLEESGRVLASLAGRGARADRLGDWLGALGALAAASGRSLDLAPPRARSPHVLARLIRELGTLARGQRGVPRLFVTWGELEPALGECTREAEELLARGFLVPVWNGGDALFAAPGCVRTPGERVPLACQGAVALNLVRLARRAGPWREEALMQELDLLLARGLDALERLDGFQAELRGARTDLLHERASFALVPVGLAETLRILGDGECRPEQGARLLGFLADAAARRARERGLVLVLTPFFGGRARLRFAALDALGRRSSQRRLFGDLPVPETELAPAYSSGFALPRAGTGDVREEADRRARLFAGVATGALFPLDVPGAERAGGKLLLELWRRFALLREPLEMQGPRTRAAARGHSPGPLFEPGSSPASSTGAGSPSHPTPCD